MSSPFEPIAERHLPALRRLAMGYARHAADAEDLLQEILFALWRAWPSFRGECSERTYVFRVAHNRALTFVSRRRAQPPPPEAEAVVDPAGDPQRQALRAETRYLLLAAVRGLPGAQREAVLLQLEGFSHQEIAEVQGTTPGNVAVRLLRARSALRLALGEPEGER